MQELSFETMAPVRFTSNEESEEQTKESTQPQEEKPVVQEESPGKDPYWTNYSEFLANLA